jgi:hypothetical protein
MKKVQDFDKIVLDNTWALWDFPVTYSVAVSNDAVTWSPPIASGSGGLGINAISFPRQSARYIRITQNSSSDTYYWSIFELDVCRKK